MSLLKQLWLAIILLLSLVFGGSFVVSSLSAKSYLEQQLYMKNTDNAAALALSLSQQEADPVLLDLTVSAQFDTGHYELVELADPEGRIVVRREDRQQAKGAPAWFIKLLPIEVAPGIAQVQQGWQQVGTLTLRSHSRFAYQELWQSTQLLALVFLAAIVIAGLLGSYLLRIILKPLDDVVEQAEAIGQRRFITLPEPSTLEFRRVVGAMNTMSERIKATLRQETARLDKWQRNAQIDRVTGLMNREPFMQSLSAALESDDVNATGTLTLVRIGGLARLNQSYGRKAIDGLLADVGAALNTIVARHSRWAASRLNGSDFALLAPRAMELEVVAREMQDAVREVMEARSMQQDVTLPAATTVYVQDDTLTKLMTRLDGGLISAEQKGNSAIISTYAGAIQALPVREQMEHWREVLQRALREQRFSLASFPVVGSNRQLIHFEAPVRLEQDGQQLAAGTFLPWINRLELSSELDQHVVDLALRVAAVRGRPLSVNLSVGALVEPSFLLWLSDRLSAAGPSAAHLWLELPESMAFRHLDAFKRLAARAKTYGCKIGIEHVGHQLAEIGQLADVGLDYLKVDSSFVRAIDSNPGNQTLLRALCSVGHSLGVIVIAEAVRSKEEWSQLQEIGFDGATGPAITDFNT
ncbi:MAG: EAL domain-containing protein [Haliea sp.]|uniref:bifunctional diguanylate cyclase/phosphodiesterase n=1 Tax=Haliea sp. TaxID=1932666 RepID=UPI0032EFC8E0